MVRVNGEMSLRNDMIKCEMYFMQDGLKERSPLPFCIFLDSLRDSDKLSRVYVKGSLDKARVFCFFVLLLLAVTFQKV